jgi:hypothetical protein
MALVGVLDIEGVLGNVVGKDDYSARRILPFVGIGEENWLIGEVGQELYDKLVEASGEDFEDTVGGDWAKLLVKVKKVCVWAAYFEYLPFSLGSDGSNGITEESGDNTKAARMWVIEKRIVAAKLNLGKEIDRLMGFLFLKRAVYTEWSESEAGLSALSLIVRSGTELKMVLPPASGYWLYKQLRGWYSAETKDLLVPIIGKALYVKLMADLEGDTLAGAYADLRWVAATYVSWSLYEKVLPTMVVVQTEDGALRVLSEFDGINNRKNASSDQLTMLYSGIAKSVADALDRLRDFLLDNAEDLPEYVVPAVDSAVLKPRFMRNEGKGKIFGV